MKLDVQLRQNRFTLLVHCGIGRGTAIPIPEVGHSEWNIQFLSPPDIFTLSHTRSFEASNLWKIFESVKQLSELGVDLHDGNSLLNLIAWVDFNNGHLIQHSRVPGAFRKSRGNLHLAPSFVRRLRLAAAVDNDFLGIPTIDGEFATVSREPDSFFAEDNSQPIYSTRQYSHNTGVPFAYLSSNRAWWFHSIPSEIHSASDYDRWVMLRTWAARIIPVIEPHFNSTLPETNGTVGM